MVNNLMVRRRQMMGLRPDTTPKIAEYGVCWSRTWGSTTANANWCITDWYNFDSADLGLRTLVGYIGADSAFITFQYDGIDNQGRYYKDWYYFAQGDQEGTRQIAANHYKVERITFSVRQDIIDDSYVYVQETGQILFAGKNSIYYGYTNINQM